ncbi:MAG TPA: hypothetical protein VF146_13180 [Bryobacteraceae bacterium]
MWARGTAWFLALAAGCAMAQESAPPGLLHGELISSQGVAKRGEFQFLAGGDRVYTCSYDERTYVERDKQSTTIDQLSKGERLEIIADGQPGSGRCYARAVETVPSAAHRSKPRAEEPFKADSWSQPFTLSGAVVSINPEILILRLRSGEHKVIRLRVQTRYLQDGQATERSALLASTVVSIRAIKNVHGETEASQVIWGEILLPRP